MKYLIATLLLLSTINLGIAQINIKGQILDVDTKETLPFAEIRISNKEKVFNADLDGEYELKDVNETDSISFFLLGYTLQKKSVNELLSNSNIQLAPADLGMGDPMLRAEKSKFIFGRIYDAKSDVPVPYVNIGITHLAIGTVSAENGHFKLERTNPNDTVTISAIGFYTQKMTAQELDDEQMIFLVPQAHEIQEIQVSSKEFGNEKLFGKKNKDRGKSIGFGNRQLGCEIGSLIKIKKETLLKSANFKINHAQGDSLLFRVNLYHYKNKKIGKNILTENIVIYAPQKRGIITVDLSPYEIILDHDILLSLEWIKDDDEKGNNGITFDTKKAKRSNVWVKKTSQAPFKVNTLGGRLGVKKKALCFWLIGKEVKTSK